MEKRSRSKERSMQELLTSSRETISRKKSQNLKNAEGSFKMTDFFKNDDSREKEKQRLEEAEKQLMTRQKLDSVISTLSALASPQMNRKSEQSKAGTYQQARHQAVSVYFQQERVKNQAKRRE